MASHGQQHDRKQSKCQKFGFDALYTYYNKIMNENNSLIMMLIKIIAIQNDILVQ